MLDNVYIIDDFYENPDAIRSLALRTSYLKFDDTSNYPGFESETSFFAENHAEKFKKYIGKDIYINPEKYVYGKFRYSVEGALSYSDVHIDSPDWSAMVYLTLDKDCKGGLAIFKHKDTCMIEIPQSQEEFLKLGYKGFGDFDRKVVAPDTKNPDAWELVELIPMKYNRLVLFKGSQYFHSITHKFGKNVENGRLTHSFFFNEKSKSVIK